MRRFGGWQLGAGLPSARQPAGQRLWRHHAAGWLAVVWRQAGGGGVFLLARKCRRKGSSIVTLALGSAWRYNGHRLAASAASSGARGNVQAISIFG